MESSNSTRDAGEAFIGDAIKSAKAHGLQSGPAYEVIDLEVLLRMCWNTMDAKRRADVMEHWAAREILEWGQ